MVPPRRSCEPVGGFAEVAETLFVDLSCAAYGTIGTPLTGSGSGSGASSASTSASTSASRWRPASDTLEAGGAGEGESALLPSFPKLETPRTRGIVHAPLRRSSDRSAAWWRSRRSSSLTSPPSPTAWSARRSTGTGLGTASSSTTSASSASRGRPSRTIAPSPSVATTGSWLRLPPQPGEHRGPPAAYHGRPRLPRLGRSASRCLPLRLFRCTITRECHDFAISGTCVYYTPASLPGRHPAEDHLRPSRLRLPPLPPAAPGAQRQVRAMSPPS